MNKVYVNQPGGFPLTTNILNTMQNAYYSLNSFGYLAGNYTIISGCISIGNTVTDGAVFIDGELYPFKGGKKISKVIIKEDLEIDEFENGERKTVVFKKYLTFGTGIKAFEFSKLKHFEPLTLLSSRVTKLEERLKKTIPIGLVAVWDRPKNQIPEGWVEHIEIRGRTPVHQDLDIPIFSELGSNIGEKEHLLTIAEMPKHRLKYKDIYWSDNEGWEPTPDGVGISGNTDHDNKGYEKNRYTDYIGQGRAHNIVQPSRIVKFIRFVGFN